MALPEPNPAEQAAGQLFDSEIREQPAAIGRLLDRLPRLRLDPDLPSRVRGLVFRKPLSLHVLWGGA